MTITKSAANTAQDRKTGFHLRAEQINFLWLRINAAHFLYLYRHCDCAGNDIGKCKKIDKPTI
jgi:hypothetical protein